MRTSMLLRGLTACACIAWSTAALPQPGPVVVRGQIVRSNGPARGVVVQREGLGRVTTGSDGMYYFFGVPRGDHVLEILNEAGQVTLRFRFTARADPTNLPPIPVPG